MAMVSTQPVTEISTGMYFGCKGDRCVGLTILPPSSADCLEILGASTSCNPTGLSRPVEGEALFLPFKTQIFNCDCDM